MHDLRTARTEASRVRTHAVAQAPKLTRSLVGLLAALLAVLALLASAGTAAAAIPSSFFTVVDQQGVNDVNADQNDLTQMGRDDSDPAFYKLFWSWDSTSLWTGAGQSGDACALFDSDGDGNIDFAACARIENPNADPTQAKLTADSPLLFACADTTNDRCSQPSPLLATGIQAGTIGSAGLDRNGNLITDTDPFAPAGSDSPNDVTLQINIPKILISGAVLVNVCSYPSAGNGGNNNPFDCIANPGGGFLVIVKNAGADTTTSFAFAVSPVPAGTASAYTIVGSGLTSPISLLVGNATETVTETVPSGWSLSGAACAVNGGATGTFDSAGKRVTGISIQSGLETRCTFTNVADVRSLSLVKSASPATYDSVGDSISYSYLVTNTGNVRLAGPVTVADNKATVTCPNVNTVGNLDSFLDPGEAVTCSATYSITQADLNSGSLTNIAKASAAGVDSNEDTETVTAVQMRSLSLVKSATPSTYDSVGDSIAYSYLVTNTGNVRLAGPVTVADDKATVTCPNVNTVGNLDSFLDPGEAVTCSASYSITQVDLNSGSVTNIAKASAAGIDSNEDTETVNAVQSRTLSLVKSALPATYDSVGDSVAYSYLVTNTGNVRLAGPVTVADNKAAVTCPNVNTVSNLDSFLDPGEAVTCSASYSITQADLNSGSVTNIAKASAAGVDSNEDTETVTAVQGPALSLVKSATPSTYDSVGDSIAYSYLVTNTGNVRLAGPVTVADNKATVTCPNVNTVGNLDSFLDPGEAITCSASYSITQADLNSGSVTNVAKASAAGIDSNEDTETVNAVQSRTLSLVKSATPSTYDSVGDSIAYSYLVTNTGNVRLAGPVTVADDKATVTCPNVNTVGNLDSFLDPGEAVTCSARYSITQADLNSGSVTNVAKASAAGVESNEDTETVNAVQSRTLSLVKSALPATYDSVGDSIAYSYLVTNTGNVRLAGPVTVADDKATVTCPNVNTIGNLDSFLDPGEAITCSASYSITQVNLNSGSVTNIAKASAAGIDSNEDTETVNAVQDRELTLDKTATPSSYDSVGDVISYSYLVTNTGNVRLAGPVTVADDKATVTCPNVNTVGNLDSFLDPSESITCTASHSITQADLNTGSLTNTAKASASQIDSNEDQATVEAVQDRKLLLDKTATPLSYRSVGDVISYSYLVTNTGNVRLAGPVTVADDKATATCPNLNTVGNLDGFLDPGEAITCTATHAITQADVNAGSLTNTARASVGETSSNEDKATVTAIPPPPPPPPVIVPASVIDLSIVKTDRPDPVFVGASLTYTLSVRNAGPDTATGVVVADVLPEATTFVSVTSTQGTCTGGNVVRCSLGTIANGGSAIITIVVRPTAPGALLNTATVVGEQAEPNTANNRASTPTLVQGPFQPPVASCPGLTVQPRSLSVGKRGIVRVLVTDKGRGVPGVRILIKGPGLSKAAITDRRGRVAISVRPPRTGIVEIRMTNQPARCSTRRIGVVGVFQPPSVTG
ncbi:MAG: hypothetical protein ABIR67_07085 [Gaiellaceae bacterium]